MKKQRLLFTLAILFLPLLLSACGGQSFASWPGVTVNGERAYLAFNQFIYAVNLQDGELVWRFPPKDPEKNISFYAPPALTPEGDLIAGGYTQSGANSKLYSLDAATGQFNWVYEQESFSYIAQPLVTPNGIFAPNADGKLYALDFQKNFLWSFPTKRAIWANPTTNETCDCIFLASMDHYLYALDAQTGNLEWKSEDLGGALASSPTFGADETIYIGTSGDRMLALDAQEEGKIRWEYLSEGWIWSGVALDEGILYFGDLDGFLYALDAATGEEIWKIQSDGAILSKPLVLDGRIYYTTENTTIYAVNLQGAPIWQRDASAKVYGPVQASNGILVVATTDLEKPLIAYNEDGDLKWTFSLKEETEE